MFKKNKKEVRKHMSTLILGKGFIGTNVAASLKADDMPFIHVSQSECDYTNSQELSTFIRDNPTISTIINCSGYTGIPNVDACEVNRDTCYSYNVIYPLRVAKLCTALEKDLIHIGSGCIYTDYTKAFTETDTPNFGVCSDISSFYSKCKHIFEMVLSVEKYNCTVLRIRIPFTNDNTRKNYLMKLLKYDTLINELNSITSVTDFCEFLKNIIQHKIPAGVYNVVNPEPITAKEVVDMLKENGLNNPNWTFIDTSDLQTVARRSNCVLSTHKIKDLNLELPSTVKSLQRDIKTLAQCLKEV